MKKLLKRLLVLIIRGLSAMELQLLLLKKVIKTYSILIQTGGRCGIIGKGVYPILLK